MEARLTTQVLFFSFQKVNGQHEHYSKKNVFPEIVHIDR